MKDRKQAAIIFIFITLLIDIIGLGIIIPVVPDLISGMMHCSISEAAEYGGWLMFAFAIMQFVFAPTLGNLSDRYGRRPVLLLSLFGFGVDYLLTGFANTIELLFIGRIFAGIFGASFTTASAYIADISTPEKRAQNFGMIGAAFGLGFIIGPVLGGILGEYGVRVPFFASAILAFVNLLYGYFILPESLSKENRRKFDWKRANPMGTLKMLNKYPVVAGLVLPLFLVYIASHSVQSTWNYFTKDRFEWSNAMVGYSLGVVGVLVAIVQAGLIRVINPWLGQVRSVYTGMALYALGLFLFAFATSSWMMFVFLVPYCLAGITGPALQGIMSNKVPANEQGELQGGLTALMSLTAIIGPPLMTKMFSIFTGASAPVYFPGAAFFLGAVLSLLSLLFSWRTLRTHPNHPH